MALDVTPPKNDSERNSRRVVASGLPDRILGELQQEYLVVGKKSIRGWHAWLAFGLVVGVATGVFLVANQTGRFSLSAAAGQAVGVEAESASLIGSVAIGNDAAASGGKYIQFGGVVTPTPTPTPTKTPTPSPTPTASPSPSPSPSPTPPPPGGTTGIWISQAEVQRLPTSGSAWNYVKSTADGSLGSPNLADQDTRHNIRTMAVALVYARTGDVAYRAKAANAIMSIIGTESGARSLALGRNIAAYVIAADLIDLKSYRASDDQRFRSWLSGVIRRTNAEGKSVIGCHEKRPNNWGTMCGASRIAADIYLNDTIDIKRAADVLHGWFGNRSVYAGFSYGDLSWQCDPSKPVGVNPKGCMKTDSSGTRCSIDGAVPDDMRRGGSFTCTNPNHTDYAWGGLSGAIAQAEMLRRAGYPAYEWQDQSPLRAVRFLEEVVRFNTSGATTWVKWLVNKHYGTSFSTGSTSISNRLVSFTDWTHAR